MVVKKVILAELVLLPLILLATIGTQISERQAGRRQVIREVTESRLLPQVLAGHTVPRLRHAVIRLRRAIRRRLHHAIHWLRVYRRDSNRAQTSTIQGGKSHDSR
jgi:hypothetical protein